MSGYNFQLNFAFDLTGHMFLPMFVLLYSVKYPVLKLLYLLTPTVYLRDFLFYTWMVMRKIMLKNQSSMHFSEFKHPTYSKMDEPTIL